MTPQERLSSRDLGPTTIPSDWDAESYATRSAFQTGEGLTLAQGIQARHGARLLDIGCGDGRITQELADEYGFDVIGLDKSPAMVRAAIARGLVAVEASAASLPFVDAEFDVVYSNAALHWVEDHPKVIREIARVLRPGGRLVARLGGAGNQADIAIAALTLFGREPFSRYRPADLRSPWNMGDPGTWAAALLRNGLRIRDLRLVTSPSGWASVEDMKSWFLPVANAFTRHLPEALHAEFFHDAVELAWSRLDPDRAFVRLIVEAER